MVDITKIDTSIQVLDIPHSWRPLRVIASMTTQHWNASASSGRDRTAKAREGCLGSRYKNGTSSQGFSTFQSLPTGRCTATGGICGERLRRTVRLTIDS